MGNRGIEISDLFILFMVSSFILIIIPTPGSASIDGPLGPMDPTIWVETERDTYTLIVEPGHVEDVPVFGTLYCEFAKGTPPGTRIFVDLKIISNLDYQGTVMHTFVKGQEEDPVDFRIDLPDMTAIPSELEYHITLYPNWYSNAENRKGMGETHTVIIDPLPYGATLIIPPQPQSFNVGESHRIDIEIKNRGNCEARYHVNVKADGLELTLPDLSLYISPGRIGTYPVIVSQSSGLGKDGYIEITVRAEVEGDLDTDHVKVHYETRARMSDVLFSPIPMIISISVLIAIVVLVVLLVKKLKRRKTASRY